MKPWLRNSVLLVLMLAASGMAMALRPTHKIADQGPAVDLEAMIPGEFGVWREEQQPATAIVDPQQKEAIDRIYAQTLTRTYASTDGRRIMLSIAYGNDQRDSNEVHKPEVCYPSQGFQVLSSQIGVIATDFGDIRIKRLMTSLGNRFEPLTYWTMVGEQVVLGGNETKVAQLSYGFRRQIPDGLIFRVSSISQIADTGYAIQQEFVQALVTAMTAKARLRLAGLASTSDAVKEVGG